MNNISSKILGNIKESKKRVIKESWVEVDHKSVSDADGFTTEYTLYKDDNGKFKTVFGDRDLYNPEDNADMEFDNEKEALDFYNSYEGIVESSYNKEDGKTDEEVYEEYMAREKERAEEGIKDLCNQITDERRQKFEDLKVLTDDNIDYEKTLVNGFWIPIDFVYAVNDSGKGHHLNPYMDLTDTNIYFLVYENDTIEDAIRSLFDEYKADSAYSWGDNFLYALDKANPNAYQEMQDDYSEEEED